MSLEVGRLWFVTTPQVETEIDAVMAEANINRSSMHWKDAKELSRRFPNIKFQLRGENEAEKWADQYKDGYGTKLQ